MFKFGDQWVFKQDNHPKNTAGGGGVLVNQGQIDET